MSIYDDAVLADNPTAYWKLHELVLPPSLPNVFCTDSADSHVGSLLTASDGLVPGIAGPILTDSPSYGMRGPVARIPGTGSADLFTAFDDFTWEAWAICTSTGTEMIINHGAVTVPTSYTSYGQRGTGLFADSAFFVLDFGVDGGREIKSCPLALNVWHHIVGTRSGAVMRLYVDAWLVASRNDCPLTAVNMGGNPFRLGYTANPIFVTVDISGGLSHAAVYATELPASRIEAHVIAAIGSSLPSPCEGAISASGSVSISVSPSSSPSASPSASPAPCTPPIGAAISCVNARGRLFVTLASDDFTSQVAFAWHEGAERMPITSVTNWKPGMRALTLQELGIAFETDNADPDNPMIVSVHRNLRKNYVRDARVENGSSRVDSLTAQFDSDNIGDMVAVFGANIGGPGINYILGRVAALASPSASPSPSSSLSASPSTTESASPSLSPSASPSSSRSGSPSPSHSPSASPSSSPSRSGSASPSVTPSASPSASPSSSQSASPSAS